MASKIILDTNVVLDYFLERPDFAEDTHRLFQTSRQTYELCITSHTVSDIYYLSRSSFETHALLKEKLDNLYSFVKILDVNEADCKKALMSNVSDYEDAILAECALRHKAVAIITRDNNDFKNAKVSNYSPKEFLKNDN
ncbi:MAG: PIN domain-containing protein [Streptococcaceae bacterium]|jgi:predicted nucleic acid-binding protein|nr:PIN domain-containing protein [Streptococcaceae bacterium]